MFHIGCAQGRGACHIVRHCQSLHSVTGMQTLTWIKFGFTSSSKPIEQTFRDILICINNQFYFLTRVCQTRILAKDDNLLSMEHESIENCCTSICQKAACCIFSHQCLAHWLAMVLL